MLTTDTGCASSLLMAGSAQSDGVLSSARANIYPARSRYLWHSGLGDITNRGSLLTAPEVPVRILMSGGQNPHQPMRADPTPRCRYSWCIAATPACQTYASSPLQMPAHATPLLCAGGRPTLVAVAPAYGCLSWTCYPTASSSSSSQKNINLPQCTTISHIQ